MYSRIASLPNDRLLETWLDSGLKGGKKVMADIDDKENSPKETFESPAPRFPLYNFHPASVVGPVRSFLLRERGPSVLLLSGEASSGRRYVLEAVAEEILQAKEGNPLVLPLDLACFDERRPYESLVELSIERYAGGRLKSQEVALAIEELSRVASKTVAEAAFLEMVLKLARSSLLPILERFVSTADIARSKLPGGERMTRLLRSLAKTRPIVVHLVQATRAHTVLRDELCEASQGCRGLRIVVSCHPTDESHRMAPVRELSHEPNRVELEPVTVEDLREAIGRRFPGNALPAELFDALDRYSEGSVGLAAAKFHQLILDELLYRTSEGILASKVGVPDLIGDSFREVLTRRILDVVNRPEIERTNAARLRRLVESSALCGRLVPIQLVADEMQLEGDDKDELLDLVDDYLVEELGVFRDHWTEHPDFPGIPMIEFTDPLERYAFLQRIDRWERSETAAGLLRELKSQLETYSFGIAHLFQELAYHLEDSDERQQLLQEVDWWIAMEEADALRDSLIAKVRHGDLEIEALWRAANLRNYWPAFRRMAVLEAYETLTEVPEAPGVEKAQFELPWDRLGPLRLLKARLSYELGLYEDSRDFAARAEKWFENDQRMAVSSKLQRHLAELQMGRLALAREGFETIVALARDSWGEDSSLTLTAMSYLAWTQRELGEYAEARVLQEHVLEQRQILGDEHPDTLTAMAQLAATLGQLGEHAEARALQEHVLERRRSILGDDHPVTLKDRINLAWTQRELGEYAEARELQEHVLEQSRRVLGDDHPDTLTAMSNLTATLAHLSEHTAARALQEHVLERRRKTLGDDHPVTLTATANLAATHGHLGEYAEARALQQHVLEQRRSVLGDEHPDTLKDMANLAWTRRQQGEYAEARELQEHVLEQRRHILGNEHPDTLAAMAELATTLGRQGRHAEARDLQEQVLERQRQILGDDHQDTLTAMAQLAWMYDRQGEHAEARARQEDVLERRRRVLGDEHPDTLEAMANLAVAYGRQGEYAEARAIQEQVLERRRQTLGDDHPDTLTAVTELAETRKALGSSQGTT
ncbi:MAG: tetratricopeptide repeat protein [Acidobacteriota bacterium]